MKSRKGRSEMRDAVGFLLFLFLSVNGFAGQWEAYLSSDEVTTIWADEEILFWGSTGGAVIENLSTGEQSKIHTANSTLKSNRITAVAKDGSGRLWIGTGGYGLAMGSEGRWKLFSTRTYSLPSDNVTAIAAFGDTVVVGTSIGVARFIDGKFSDYYVSSDWLVEGRGDDFVNCVAVNGEMMLVGTNDGLFSLHDRFTWSRVHEDTVISLDYDGTGSFWFIAGRQKIGIEVYRFDGVTKRRITNNGIPTNMAVRSISARSDTVWIATEWGPRRFDIQADRWIRELHNLSLLQQDCYSLYVSHGGRVWLATRDSSVAEFVIADNDTAWVFHKSGGPAGNYVEDIAIDINGNVWFTTGERGFKPWARGMSIGILMFDGKKWHRFGYGYNGVLKSNLAYRVESNPLDKSVWIGYWDAGLVRYGLEDSTWTSYSNRLRSQVVPDVYVDKKGRVFFGQYGSPTFRGGVGIICPVSDCDTLITFYLQGEPCMNAKWITAIGPGPSGSVMTGNYAIEGDDEVHLIKIGLSVKNKNDDYCQRWQAATNYLGGYCHDISLDSSNVAWLGTDGGLSAFDPETQRWSKVTSAIGKVFDIEVDKFNRKWVATDRGLWVLTQVGQGLSQADFKTDFYDNSNSPLPDLPVMAIEFDADGYLWIGTDNGGIFRFKPDEPETTVTKVKAWVDVYPNPFDFRKSSVLSFNGCKPGTQVEIYTLTGEKVAELDCGESLSKSQMDRIGMVSGIYIYHAYAENGKKFVGKFVVIR